MSKAQVPYLQYLNAKKLCQDEDCLRRLVAHLNLRSRLEPLARDADEELVTEEMRRWFEVKLGTHYGYCSN
jgi:hypothetical protein